MNAHGPAYFPALSTVASLLADPPSIRVKTWTDRAIEACTQEIREAGEDLRFADLFEGSARGAYLGPIVARRVRAETALGLLHLRSLRRGAS